MGEQRWTIKREDWQSIGDPDTDQIEVVPASEADRLRAENEKLNQEIGQMAREDMDEINRLRAELEIASCSPGRDSLRAELVEAREKASRRGDQREEWRQRAIRAEKREGRLREAMSKAYAACVQIHPSQPRRGRARAHKAATILAAALEEGSEGEIPTGSSNELRKPP